MIAWTSRLNPWYFARVCAPSWKPSTGTSLGPAQRQFDRGPSRRRSGGARQIRFSRVHEPRDPQPHERRSSLMVSLAPRERPSPPSSACYLKPFHTACNVLASSTTFLTFPKSKRGNWNWTRGHSTAHLRGGCARPAGRRAFGKNLDLEFRWTMGIVLVTVEAITAVPAGAPQSSEQRHPSSTEKATCCVSGQIALDENRRGAEQFAAWHLHFCSA